MLQWWKWIYTLVLEASALEDCEFESHLKHQIMGYLTENTVRVHIAIDSAENPRRTLSAARNLGDLLPLSAARN